MHWSEKIALKVIERNPNKEEYVCAAGISPSGSVHVGNFRDIAIPYFVCKALQKLGKKAKLLFSWDDFDRLRKVPVNVSNVVSGFEKYIGMPYTQIPCPFDENENYASYFQKEFESAMKVLGVDYDVRYQTKEYLSGRYAKNVAYALEKRKEIYDILMSFKTQEANNDDREKFYPVSVYCSGCFKDTTKVTNYNPQTHELTYFCRECGKEETVNVLEYYKIKLIWKVDWPMRWREEGVDFEAGGIDHAASGGSYDVDTVLSPKIWGYTAPVFQGYGWLGFQGVSSMHSSSGLNITPNTALKLYEPEILRWLFCKYEPKDAYNFYFDETIIRHYSEFDKNLASYLDGTCDEFTKDLFDLVLIKKENKVKTPFGTIASIAPIVDFKLDKVKFCLEKAGIEFDEDSYDRVTRAEYWIKNYMPQKMYKLLENFNTEFASTLSEEQKDVVKQLYNYLSSNEVKEKEVQQYLYDIINNPELSKKENMALQQSYFKIFYNLLFGRDDGPRLYLFFSAANKEDYLKLLNV